MSIWLDAFQRQVAAGPHRIAVISDQESFTYGQLWEASRSATDAQRLGRRRMIVEHDPVLALQQIINAFQVGDVPVPLLPTLPQETVHQLAVRLGKSPPERMNSDPEQGEGLVLTTSGSTGAPKQVVLPHRSVSAILDTMTRYFLAPGEPVLLVAGSLTRILPLITGTLVGLARGWKVVLFKEGTPPPALHRAFREHGVTHIHASPSFFRLFLQYWNGQPFESQVFVSASGEVISPELQQRMRAAFPHAEFYMGFGATESGRISFVNMADPRYARGGVGRLLPTYQGRVLPMAGVTPPVGELSVKGAAVMLGYLRDDGRYEGVGEDGFFATGDLVEQDADGYMYFRGRVDSLVKVGGHRVNAFQTEAVIRRLPGVAEVRCFAEPHPILGSVVVAEVQPKDGETLTAEQVRRHSTASLEPQQVPREIRIVPVIARTAAGKLARSPTPGAGR